MNIPDSIAYITPGLATEWKYASISTSYLSYDYKHEDNTDVFIISSEKALHYAMHIPSRSSRVISVTVNGVDTDYTLTGFVNFITPVSNNSIIRVLMLLMKLLRLNHPKSVHPMRNTQ